MEAWAAGGARRPRAAARRRAGGAARAGLGARAPRAADRRCVRALPRRRREAVATSRLARAGRRPAAALARRGRRGAGRRSTRFWRSPTSAARRCRTRWMRLNLCELGLRAGEWETVARLLDEWAESGRRRAAGHRDLPALPRAARGRPRARDEAERWAAPALAGAEARGYRWQVLEARARSGSRRCSRTTGARGRAPARVWEHTEREGVDEPGAFPVAPDLVEALAALGALDEARAVAARLRALADAQDHPWARATAERCDALVALAGRRRRGGARPTRRDAAGRLRAGSACRSTPRGRGSRSAARCGAQEVGRRARRARGGRGGVRRARLRRLGRAGALRARPRRRAPPAPEGELTPAERRVAELAAAGRSNKEIARRPLRHRAHRRGAPLAALREARRPLPHAAGAAPRPRKDRWFPRISCGSVLT